MKLLELANTSPIVYIITSEMQGIVGRAGANSIVCGPVRHHVEG